MNNLTKKQWATFAVTIVSLILTFLVDSGGFGLGVKGVAILGLLKQGWDLYTSFSAQNVADFATHKNFKASASKKSVGFRYTKDDVKDWCKK